MTAIRASATASTPLDDDRTLLDAVVGIAERAGDRLLHRFDRSRHIDGGAAILAALQANEDAVGPDLRAGLIALRPSAAWLDTAAAGQEDGTADPLTGEWWVVDAVEGNINHVHGTEEWGVAITLLRGGAPVLAVVRQPLGDLTWTAMRGRGALRNGEPLRVSAKTELRTAIVTTGQAEAGQRDTYRRIGDSVTAMLHHALLVRTSVPSTFPMLLVAAGRNDVFWQYRPSLAGVAAGVLFVTEAGGRVTAVDGAPWSPRSPDIVATTPHLQAAALGALAAMA